MGADGDKLKRRLAILLACMLAAACISERTVRNGQLNTRALERTFQRTEALRQLKRTSPVPSKAISKRDVRRVLATYMRGHSRAASAEQVLHRRLGILGPALGRSDVDERMMEGPVAGFYIPDSRQLFVISDYSLAVRLQMDMIGMLNGTDFGYDMILSHEIAHALQHQHHNLMRLDDTGGRDNTDRSLAFVSLIESDANVVGYAYSHAMDPRGDIKRAVLHGYIRLNYWLNLPLIGLLAPGVPAFYREMSFGHYVRGLPIVERALASGGWPVLDQVYREAMPESTEQVMYPEKLFGPRCDPPVQLPDMVTPDQLSGWAHVWSSTFGALQLKSLLAHHGAWWWQSDRLARRWGGDRFSVWQQGERVALVWRWAWDDEEAARDFVARWAAQLRERYANIREEPGNTASSRHFVLSPEVPGPSADHVQVHAEEGVAMERRGRRVVLVEGAEPTSVSAVVQQAWAALPPEAVTVTSGRCPAARLMAAEVPSELPGPTLADRLFLPHRTIYASFATGWSSLSPTNMLGFSRRALRWAVRDGLVWDAAGNNFSLRASGPPVQTAVSLAVNPYELQAAASLHVFAHDNFALVAEARSFRPWGEGLHAWDADFLTVGFAAKLSDRLVVSAAGLWLREAAAMLPGAPVERPSRRLAVGSPMGVGGNGMPLLEWRLHDAAWLFWDPLVLLNDDGSVAAHSHRVGVGLYL